MTSTDSERKTLVQQWKGKNKSDLPTPCLVLDQARLQHNLTEMQAWIKKCGKNLRPHIKTHKCTILAKKQIELGAIGICVTKVSEAEVAIREGIKAVLITSPHVGNKIPRIVECAKRSSELMVVVDHPKVVEMLQKSCQDANVKCMCLVDVNGGQNRTGVDPSEALNLAKLVHAQPNLVLKGVQMYVGNLQHIQSFEERRQQTLMCMGKGAAVVRQIREAGLPCDIFTGGGTGTFEIDMEIPEITDVQPGSYTVMDVEYQVIGCSQDPNQFLPTFRQQPMTLLATVVSEQKNSVTIDAGLKALYKDGPGPKIIAPNANLSYRHGGDEHGYVSYSDPKDAPKLGDQVELIVSHCDPTINLHKYFFVLDKDVCQDVWPIDLQGCCQ